MREKSRIFVLAMLLIMLAARPVQAARHAAGELPVKSAIAMDLGSGRILYEQNPDQQIPPASLTKIITLYLTFEALQEHRLSLTEPVVVSREAANEPPTRMSLRPGEHVIVRELMKGIAVASGNDACVVMAQRLSGGGNFQPFVAAMNAKARELGMTETVFKNPNGLPAAGQLTSARDMLRLSANYLRRFPQALTFHSMTTYAHNNRNHHNANRLLGSYEGADGLKTGFVQASGYNNVVTAKHGETRIIAVVLGARTAGVRTAATRKLLDIGFARMAEGKYLSVLDERRGTGVLPAVLARTAPRETEADLHAAQQIADLRANQVRGAVEPAPAEKAKAAKNQPTLVRHKRGKASYAIQESSFQSRKMAVRRAQRLEKKGLPVRVVATRLGGSRWYRVLVGPYASIDAAKKTREKMLTRGSVTEE